jgi:fido (protein-threonine AMPylation protein)
VHPKDCPGWEYDDVNGARDLIKGRAAAVLLRLRQDKVECTNTASETRTVHTELFQGLTPARCDYFAGHYRGEDFRCLKNYRVQIAADPMVGRDPDTVIADVAGLAAIIQEGIADLDAFAAAGRSRPALLVHLVRVAARVFQIFLTIHPYANGNGHAARVLVCAILGRYGFWPSRWTVEPRPADPPYSPAIAAHRRGKTEPLEKFLLDCAKWG